MSNPSWLLSPFKILEDCVSCWWVASIIEYLAYFQFISQFFLSDFFFWIIYLLVTYVRLPTKLKFEGWSYLDSLLLQ